MNGYEIIKDIVKARMPDREQVREECVQAGKTSPSRKSWIARTALVAVPVCAVVIIAAFIAGKNGVIGTSKNSPDNLLSLNNGANVEGLYVPDHDLPVDTGEAATNNKGSENSAENGYNNGSGGNGGNNGNGGNGGNGENGMDTHGDKDNTVILYAIDNNMGAFDSRYSVRGAYFNADNPPSNSCSYTIAMGERTTGGYSITIDKVTIDSQGNAEVVVSEKTPNKEFMVIQALTYPICKVTFFGEPKSVVIKTIVGEVLKVMPQ